MTYPPPPGGWQDPNAGWQDPNAPQSGSPYADPISGQPGLPVGSYPPADGQPPYGAGQPSYGAEQQPYGAIPAYPGYEAYSAPAPYPTYQAGYPGYQGYATPPVITGPRNNGLAIASMVVSIAGVFLLSCYGAGGIACLVGAILGHIARKQVANRGDAGGGMALAGIIVGWIGVAISVIVIGIIVWAIVALNNYEYDPYSDMLATLVSVG